LAVPARLVVEFRADDDRIAGDGVDRRRLRVGVGDGAPGGAAVDAGDDVRGRPGIRGVVAGVAIREDHRPGGLVYGDLRHVLRAPGDLVAVGQALRVGIAVGLGGQVVDGPGEVPGPAGIVGILEEDVGVLDRVLQAGNLDVVIADERRVDPALERAE